MIIHTCSVLFDIVTVRHCFAVCKLSKTNVVINTKLANQLCALVSALYNKWVTSGFSPSWNATNVVVSAYTKHERCDFVRVRFWSTHLEAHSLQRASIYIHMCRLALSVWPSCMTSMGIFCKPSGLRILSRFSINLCVNREIKYSHLTKWIVYVISCFIFVHIIVHIMSVLSNK